jgi:hypothetical protein
VADWHELVRQRLGPLRLDARREDEIVTELADHFDDASQESGGSEISAGEAMSRALAQVSDWEVLRREIMRAENEEAVMNRRTKTVWLPGLVGLTLSMSLFWFLDWAGLHPRIVWMEYNPPLLFSLPWLLALPVLGAGCAYASRRSGGANSEQLLAGVFPAMAMAILLLAILPVSIVMDSHVPWILRFGGFASALLGWVVIPGVALLAGAAVILATHHGTSSRQTA